MHTSKLFLLILFLTSCIDNQSKNVNQDQDPNNAEISTNSKQYIKQEISNNKQLVVYIDTSATSKYYLLLNDFTIDNRMLQSELHLQENDKKLKLNLPENWLPVYSFQKKYYLYAPSDLGNVNKLKIENGMIYKWGNDGIYPTPISSFKEDSNGKITLGISNNTKALKDKSRIHITEIDSITGLSIFEFVNHKKDSFYQLYLPANNATSYDIIVNYSKDGKQHEFTFDSIDFPKLLLQL